MSVTKLRILFVMMLMLGTAQSARAQEAQPPVRAGAGYLQPGDVVKLWIWREEEMSGDFPVPETGVIVFPKIGPWQVTQKSPDQLKTELRDEYLKYLRNPSIELTFLRRVSVLGAVREPGLYPVDETMSVASVIALAGGTTEHGRPDRVQLFRDGEVLVTRITQRTRISDLPLHSGDQLYVPERSWLARNTPLVSAMVSGLVSVTIALIVQK